MAVRALIVAALAGSFLGSVLLASRNTTSSEAVAARAAAVESDPVTTGSVARPGKAQPAAR
jgi:hypothetical protein